MIGIRPPSDPVARAVALAHVTSALLGTDDKVKLGRYHLLERAGAGGMGVVYAAWDPELDRRVAIKILHVEASAKRERALAEGQALAKLSHPNVVAMHDVGVFDDQLYLVMEWIRGTNLRAHCADRSVREIVDAYRAAGEGLHAAHEAGLVHRDFKPENVMVGDDGRVRVLDFGLALAEQAPAMIAGTPRYMAPEQRRGEPVTSAADQYAFCIALREALGAKLPKWIARIVERGLAQDPAARFASMHELLDALTRDPMTVWRRRMFAAVAASIAFTLGFARGGDVDRCTGAPDELARSWNPALAMAVHSHLDALGPYSAAEAERITAQLTGYGKRWSLAHRGACAAHERGDVTAQIYERGLGCLARARVALETIGGVLAHVPAERLSEAILASRGLPDVERCLTDTAASPVPPPSAAIAHEVETVSADVARASYLVLAGDPTAGDVVRPAAAAADHLGYAPLVARAQLALGSALALERRPAGEAIAAYERAIASAVAGTDDVTFVEAYARELFLAGRSPAGATALAAQLPLVTQISERSGTLGSFARALLYNNAGTTRLAAGDTAGAHAWFARAYDVPHAGTRGIELYAIYGNLAATTADPTERARLFREQRTHLETELGPTHVLTLTERVRSMQFVADDGAAADGLDDLCRAFATWHPHRADKIDPCAYELATLARRHGDLDRARAALALVSKQPTEPRNRLARAAEALLAGDARTAASEAERVVDENAHEGPWWARFWAVEGNLLAANARAALGDTVAALAAARAARALLGEPGFDLQLVYLQRRVAAADALIAKLTGDRGTASVPAAGAGTPRCTARSARCRG